MPDSWEPTDMRAALDQRETLYQSRDSHAEVLHRIETERSSSAQDGLRVVAAAVRFKGGVFSMPPPARHAHLDMALETEISVPTAPHDQGFLLSDGSFASREVAHMVAYRNGVRPRHPQKLFSEDLW